MTSSPPTSTWLSVDEAAEYASLSRRSIERLIAGRKLTVYRPVARRRLLDRAEIDAMIRATGKAVRR